MTVLPIRRALVSVYDKTGVEDLAKGLHDLGVEVVSTGSTAARIRDAGIPVTAVSDVTGFPECLDGRVKTLHPRVHAGILADRDKPEHLAQLDELDVTAIDLVVANLYPFAQTVASGADDADVVEMIDIGGPTMVRAAAKNFASVTVVVRPDHYDALLADLREGGGTTIEVRQRLAAEAFAHTAAYDAAVANWFAEPARAEEGSPERDETHPRTLHLSLSRRQSLRYGENPHQRAAFYVEADDQGRGLGGAVQLHGKALSYNNLLDADAALGMVQDLDEPAVAIIKHLNPAGLAVAGSLAEAYPLALSGDPVSAFGGIVAVNRVLDAATAAKLIEVFTEVVIAPDVTDDALEVLRAKKNLRVLRVPDAPRPAATRAVRSIDGGVLVQDGDVGAEPYDDWRVVSQAQPDDTMLADLRFAWVAAKHVKSNAIVLAREAHVVGVGAGQMSRIDSVRLAVEKSGDRHRGAVLASDAFFPFRDGTDAAAAAGIVAMVQPGGSVRDEEVVAAADEHGLVMVMTGRRHFRH